MMRYKIQFWLKFDPKWVEMGAEDTLSAAIDEAVRRNKLHKPGTIIHRVFDTETTTVKFERGVMDGLKRDRSDDE